MFLLTLIEYWLTYRELWISTVVVYVSLQGGVVPYLTLKLEKVVAFLMSAMIHEEVLFTFYPESRNLEPRTIRQYMRVECWDVVLAYSVHMYYRCSFLSWET